MWNWNKHAHARSRWKSLTLGRKLRLHLNFLLIEAEFMYGCASFCIGSNGLRYDMFARRGPGKNLSEQMLQMVRHKLIDTGTFEVLRRDATRRKPKNEELGVDFEWHRVGLVRIKVGQ